jgi:Thiol:disulfide interchange protein DsbD, N-terminal
MPNMRRLVVAVLIFSATAFAQGPGPKAPSVTVAPIAPVSVQRGKSANFELYFRVGSGFHINSNQPKDEYLIPTSLKLDPPNDVAIGKIEYPQGQDVAFAFSPTEKINVYSGDVAITGVVRTMSTASYGTYRVHGTLTYQACDHAACYPPKRLPVQFDIKVVKAPSGTHRRNPGQSPNIR